MPPTPSILPLTSGSEVRRGTGQRYWRGGCLVEGQGCSGPQATTRRSCKRFQTLDPLRRLWMEHAPEGCECERARVLQAVMHPSVLLRAGRLRQRRME
eukprot:3608497-Rhodomonas_salina.1